MFHLFIDTNILIRFYAFTDDSLDEAEKFIALVETKKICLYVPEQITHEYLRNSESELAKSLGDLDSSKFNISLPRFIEHYDEAATFKKLAKECLVAKTALLKKVRADASDGNLRADRLVKQLLLGGKSLLRDDAVVAAARLRRDIGNPPGKSVSLGDQINWEHLLKAVPDKCDLHVISRDGDFASKFNSDLPNRFLAAEWRVEKSAGLFLYPSLGHFAKKHFPEIKIPTDIVKAEAIKDLVGSTSFASTHSAISRLESVFDEIALEEAIKLLQAMVDNQQIDWISDDQDVQELYSKLYLKYWVKLPKELENKLATTASYLVSPL